MKQSRLGSFTESVINTAAGFGLSLFCQWLFLPLLGVAITLTQNLAFAVLMTAVSIGRQYVLRRVFEFFRLSRPLSPFMLAVIAERFRQGEVEGYGPTHDDGHTPRELAQAGAAYLLGADEIALVDQETGELQIVMSGRKLWPWHIDFWKPRELRRDLVRGCALGIAAGELADRRRKRRSAAERSEGPARLNERGAP